MPWVQAQVLLFVWRRLTSWAISPPSLLGFWGLIFVVLYMFDAFPLGDFFLHPIICLIIYLDNMDSRIHSPFPWVIINYLSFILWFGFSQPWPMGQFHLAHMYLDTLPSMEAFSHSNFEHVLVFWHYMVLLALIVHFLTVLWTSQFFKELWNLLLERLARGVLIASVIWLLLCPSCW